MAREHELKCWPGPFQAVKSGRKPFEYRKNDRDFREGDSLWLREWEPTGEVGVGFYTGDEHRATISFVLTGGKFGVPPGYAVLGLERATPLAEGGVPAGWPSEELLMIGAAAQEGSPCMDPLGAFTDGVRAMIAAAPVPVEGGGGSSQDHAPTTGSPLEGDAAVIIRIANVAAAVGWQAGVPATDIAGLIVSFLAVNPEHVARFVAEGAELFIDGTIRPEGGCLTYTAKNGDTISPSQLRELMGEQQ